jgi:hypothetical protein
MFSNDSEKPFRNRFTKMRCLQTEISFSNEKKIIFLISINELCSHHTIWLSQAKTNKVMSSTLPPLFVRIPPPKEYSRTHRPFQFRAFGQPIQFVPGATRQFRVSLAHSQSASQRETTTRANREKSELLSDLSIAAMDAVDLLDRLSNCLTPYASLFKQAVDEFSFGAPPSRAQKVDDLERESAVQCAKKEVEIQQLLQRIERMKADGVDIRGRLVKQQQRLDSLNNHMEKLSHLLEITGYTPEENPAPAADEAPSDRLQMPASLPLDEAKYKELWRRNVELQENVSAMQEQLKEVQARQVVAYHKRGHEAFIRQGGRARFA